VHHLSKLSKGSIAVLEPSITSSCDAPREIPSSFIPA
jgi:hypothetical protein